MRLCNETITVFNTRLDAETGFNVYIPTVITGASWRCEVASVVDAQGGLKAANKFIIRIPEDASFSGKTYVSPAAYAQKDPKKFFTLKNGDIVVRGAVEDSCLKPADLQRLFGEVVTILGVADNRRALNAKHWKVVGA